MPSFLPKRIKNLFAKGAPDAKHTEAGLTSPVVGGIRNNERVSRTSSITTARKVTVIDPKMIDIRNDIFSTRTMRGAALHSTARYPPPRCHPNTRKSLRARINHWGINPERESRMLWIVGSAGAGKSALAQTVAEEFEELGLLGATLFFSRSNHRDNPNRVIPTLANQLHFHEAYRDAIDRIIQSDTKLMEQDRHTQFNSLIIEPIDIFMTEWSQRQTEPEDLRPFWMAQDSYIRTSQLTHRFPWVVFLDGLDECNSAEAQCEFIDLICSQVRREYSLLWVICSRPEPHLECAFRKAEAEGLCWVEELRIDDPETQSDVERYLNDEFERISKKYPDDLGGEGTWLPKDTFDRIVRASSGHFLFATTLIKYLDQPNSTPRFQLSAIIAAIDGAPLPSGAVNPLVYIDNLYLEILGRLDDGIRSKALELLAVCMACPPLPVLNLSQLLEIDLSTILDALFPLHSIISVPYRDKLVDQPLHYYHASFTDFLASPDRSRQFSQVNLHTHHYRLASACFRVLANTKTSYAGGLTWDSSHFDTANPSNLSVSHGIFMFAATHIWDICSKIRDPKLEFVRDNAASFDYRLIQSAGNVVPPQSFVRFLRWLYSAIKDIQDLSELIRTSAHSDLDSRFLERCTEDTRPLEMDLQDEEIELKDIPRYVLVGFKERTVLVLIIPKRVVVYSMEEIEDL